MAPARTPVSIIRRLHGELARIASREEMKAFVLSQGSQSVALGPAETAAYLKADMARWAKVVKSAKIAAE